MELKNKSLQKAYDSVQNYYKVKAECTAQRSVVSSNYAGEMLQVELTRLEMRESNAKSDMGNAIVKLRDDMVLDLKNKRAAALERGAQDALDGSKITADFAILGLPIKLTGEEMQQLYDKNWNNPLFVRALQKYEDDHRGGIPVDYTDAYTKAIDAVWRAFNYVDSYSRDPGRAQVLRDNPQRMEQYDEMLTEAIEKIASV